MATHKHSEKFIQIMEKIDNTKRLEEVIKIKEKLENIEISAEVGELLEICNEKIKKIQCETEYQEIKSSIANESQDFQDLINRLEALGDYKDCEDLLSLVKKESEYASIVHNIGNNPDAHILGKCILRLEKLGDYKDSKQLLATCKGQYENTKQKKKKQNRKIIILSAVFMLIIGVLLIYHFSTWKSDEAWHWHPFSIIHTSHNFSFTITKKPTCNETGIRTCTCKECGAIVLEELEIVKHEYDDGVIIKEPSCTETGIKTYTCKNCSTFFIEDIAMVDHELGNEVITKTPTCLDSGEKAYMCKNCGNIVKVETIPPLNHSVTEIVFEHISCTTNGRKIERCSICGYELSSETILATGHEFDEGHITKEPTHTNNGIKTYTCKICGESYSVDYMYKVGDIGPAGGYIFYDCDEDNNSGNFDGLQSSTCGWRFIEAAPTDLPSHYLWGESKQYGLSELIGKGKDNTTKLPEKVEGYTTAAKACLDYSVNGYDDWFLPSINELNKMEQNLFVKHMGNFDGEIAYFSSSQSRNFSIQLFSFKRSGYVELSSNKLYNNNSYNTRPIRYF